VKSARRRNALLATGRSSTTAASSVVRLPQDVREEDVKATYKNGVLKLRVPLAEPRSEPTRVPVERG